jgi:hypothetical protein
MGCKRNATAPQLATDAREATNPSANLAFVDVTSDRTVREASDTIV